MVGLTELLTQQIPGPSFCIRPSARFRAPHGPSSSFPGTAQRLPQGPCSAPPRTGTGPCPALPGRRRERLGRAGPALQRLRIAHCRRCPASPSAGRHALAPPLPTRSGSLAPARAKAEVEAQAEPSPSGASSSGEGEGGEGGGLEVPEVLSKEVAKVVKKTATTFAPRASTKSKNPAVPGSTLYTVFEVQGYLSMALGGLLSFNLLFPSNEPDIWRLMGMWSVWMFTIPSLRARDCSEQEKSALNYLFLVVPLVNVTLPLVWKSFAAVWTTDVITFFLFYAWKLDWLKQKQETSE